MTDHVRSAHQPSDFGATTDDEATTGPAPAPPRSRLPERTSIRHPWIRLVAPAGVAVAGRPIIEGAHLIGAGERRAA